MNVIISHRSISTELVSYPACVVGLVNRYVYGCMMDSHTDLNIWEPNNSVKNENHQITNRNDLLILVKDDLHFLNKVIPKECGTNKPESLPNNFPKFWIKSFSYF